MELRIESLTGAAIATHVEALAHLRCTVFREWPYLYEGSHAYEARYLGTYIDCPHARCILVWDGDQCVGASTVIPLIDAPQDMQQPFTDAGVALDGIDYFGESVLLPDYRGRGLGVRFFELREQHAREFGLSTCTFCAVQRRDDHPLKPAGYAGNEAFWRKRGYRPAPHLQTTLDWLDIGEAHSTRKPMQFWQRHLESA